MTKIQTLLRFAIALVVLAFLGFALCSYQVSSAERVVVTRFGKPVAVPAEAGLYFRLAWPVDQIHRFDSRLSFYETRVSEALTQDKRNVIVPLFVVWRIEDPLRFLQAVATREAAQSKLDSLSTSARNAFLGAMKFSELVSSDASTLRLAELERKILREVGAQANEAFGIEVVHVGLRRIALPEANTTYVFERMRAERGQYAARYRAEGRREAEELRTKADAEKASLLAEAQRYADETRGKAEAEAARVFAEAHEKSPEFYSFLRNIDLIKKSAKEGTTLVVEGGREPFSLLYSAPASK